MRNEISLSVYKTQSCIIKAQQDIIDELYAMLMQHITVNEASEITEKIKVVANLRTELEK